MQEIITITKGQTWYNEKTWWRVRSFCPGNVMLEGPRGSILSSLDDGKTWSDPIRCMTEAGFLAWIRKTGAKLKTETLSV